MYLVRLKKLTMKLAVPLNMDFRLYPEKLGCIADLFSGAIIQHAETMLVITNEVYGRSLGMDIHAEKEDISWPKDNKQKYTNITCGIYKQADSPQLSRKLIIGTKTLYILITCSTTISSTSLLSIGLATELTASSMSSSARIYLRDSSITKFQSSSTTIKNLSKLRQVTTNFQDMSTYQTYRSSPMPFDDDLHHPAFVFTLCDISNNKGYGLSDKSLAKMMSKFLQITAVKIINKNTSFEISDYDDVFKKLEQVQIQQTKKDPKAAKVLNSLFKAMESYKAKYAAKADIVDFARSYSLSPLANSISSCISTANKEIASNITTLLSELYGR